MKYDSIHKIYQTLSSGSLDLEEYLETKYPINSIFHCCNSYHTILSYAFKKEHINLSLVKSILSKGGTTNIIFLDYTSPLFYLFKYQKIHLIKEIIETNQIDIYGASNFHYILYMLLMKNEREKWLYLTNKKYEILLSPITINLSKGYFDLKNTKYKYKYNKRLQLPDCNQQNWLITDCIEIYYTLILMCYNLGNSNFNNIPVEIIKKIYLFLFI